MSSISGCRQQDQALPQLLLGVFIVWDEQLSGVRVAVPEAPQAAVRVAGHHWDSR